MVESEVARLRQQIEAEYTAAQLALQGPAMVARHAFITTKPENMRVAFEALTPLVGKEEAVKLLAESIWPPTERGESNEASTARIANDDSGYTGNEL